MDDIPMVDAGDDDPQLAPIGIYPYPHFINPAHLFPRNSSSIESSRHSEESRMSVTNPYDEVEVELVTPSRDINRRIAILYPGVDQESTPLPTHWSSIDRRETIYVSPDKTVLKYKGLGVNHQDAASVRANNPIPHGCGVYYFEVTIVTPERNASDSLIGIGIMEKNIQTNRLPGWDNLSFGYHGDDGNFFCSSGKGQLYGPKFGINDCVGCGVNFARKQIFFTKNGENLGYIDINLSLDHEYYPVVGMQASNEVVQTNFGQRPFLYNIQKDFARARSSVKKSFNSIKLPPEKAIWMNEAVGNWLTHLGYADTIDAFSQITNLDIAYNREAMLRRNNAINVIKSGQLSKNMKEIEEQYQYVLEHNKHLQLLLRIQAFIEDVMEVAREKKALVSDSQPGSSRQNQQQQQQKQRRQANSSPSTLASQRSGTKRRNSQTDSLPSSSSTATVPNYHRSYSRESQNGCSHELECSNGHSNNGCPATTTTIISEMHESNGISAAHNDAEMEDLSTAAMQPPSRRKEVIHKNQYEEFKGYTKLIEKSQSLWKLVKQIELICDKLYGKVMEVLEMMTIDVDEIYRKFPYLISQEHRDLVATVFNRSVLDFEGDCGYKIPIGNLITLLESMHPKISQYSPGGIQFADVDDMIFDDRSSDEESTESEQSSPERIALEDEEESGGEYAEMIAGDGGIAEEE